MDSFQGSEADVVVFCTTRAMSPTLFFKDEGEKPGWFKDGINAALLAPTALNKQAFFIRGKSNKVSIACDNGIFTGVDPGLVKYHFKTGAGAKNFEWF